MKSNGRSSGVSFLDEKVRKVHSYNSVSVSCDPQPLPEKKQYPEYPVNDLGPVLAPAVRAIAKHVQVPMGIAAQSVLATASLAVQGHYDVQRGNISEGPASLYFITIAESGERKSSTDKIALKPVRDYEKKRREEYSEKILRYKSELEAWEAEKKKLLRSCGGEEKLEGGDSVSKDLFAASLYELEMRKPVKPAMPNITISEPTAEGVFKHLKDNHPSGGLFNDDAVGFFDGHGMSDDARGRTIETLCRLWDGAILTRTRATNDESFVLAGRRMSAHLMVQPIIADKVMSDKVMQGQGFLPRFLICNENSLMGERFIRNNDTEVSVEHLPQVSEYYKAIERLIKKPLPLSESGEIEPQSFKIEGEAFREWCRFHDDVEVSLGKGGEFYDIRAFASKAAENCARLAAVMGAVEGLEIPTVDLIRRASRVITYYLITASLRDKEFSEDHDEVAAREVLEWMQERGGELSQYDFKKLNRAYRRAKEARRLLRLLENMGHVRVAQTNQRGEASSWVVLTAEA